MEVAGGLARSVPRGLGRIEPTGDVLVAYAAKAGTVVEDGEGQHSPYAEALLSTLATPGLDIRLVMGRVRDLVLAKTAGTQEPFVYSSLGGANVALVSPGLEGALDTTTGGSDAKVARDYELAAKVGTKEAWDAFLSAHPTGFHADLARARLRSLTLLVPPTRTEPDKRPPSPGTARQGWEELVCQRVSLFGVDRDAIRIGRREGRFKAIRLLARGADIDVLDLAVVYGNGKPEYIPVRSLLRQGDRTVPLDLRRWEQFIDRIGLTYRTTPNSKGQATVCVEGLR